MAKFSRMQAAFSANMERGKKKHRGPDNDAAVGAMARQSTAAAAADGDGDGGGGVCASPVEGAEGSGGGGASASCDGAGVSNEVQCIHCHESTADGDMLLLAGESCFARIPVTPTNSNGCRC
jgi:hypothetical protein